MINGIPVFGWVLSFLLSISYSIPFWFLWTICGYGRVYFSWLPPIYQSIPFWDCVCLVIVISILKAVLIPRAVVSASATSENKKA